MSGLLSATCVLLIVLLTIESISTDRFHNIVELTPAKFNELMKDDDIWVVDFYTAKCKRCKFLMPEYRKLAKAFKGFVKVGTVNLTEYKQLGIENGVRSVPKIKIFSVNKLKPFDYDGDLDAVEIAEEVLYEIKKKVLLEIVQGGKIRRHAGPSINKRKYK